MGHEFGVGLGQNALGQIEIVLHPHPHMAAKQLSLRHHREFRAADAEAGPDRARRQQAAAVQHGLRRGVETVFDAEHQ